MSKRTSLIYLAIAPILFVLSWYISHEVYVRFLQSNSEYAHTADRSLVYASVLTGIYVVAFFVIRDLYPAKRA